MKIEDLRIGMVVEEFMPVSQRYSPPMKVTGIFKGATDDTDWVYLEFEEHEGDPFEAHPKDLREVKQYRVKEGQMWLLFIVIMWIVLSLCGCKQVKYVPVKEVRTVEVEKNGLFGVNGSYVSNETTNVLIHDSVVVVVNQQGEEVIRKEYHEKETDREYREKYEELLMMYESLQSEKTDTVEVPYPVERKLGRWEQTCVNYGGEAIVGCFVLMFIVGWMVYKRFL